MTSAAPTCVVCYGEYERSRPCVTCKACGAQACRECVRAYLLTVLNPECVECHRHWDTTTLLTCGVGQTWAFGPLRAHREAMLWDLEQARLPDTQPLALLLQREQEASRHLDGVQAHIQRMLVDKCYSQWHSAHLNRNAAKRYLWRAQHDVRQWISNRTVATQQGKGKGDDPVARVVQRCPQAGCLGFVTARTMTCGLCATALCGKCRQVVSDGTAKTTSTPPHECNPSDVATVQLLKADTKPCPKCAAPIYKIDGCDQMWCTACHVAFSWKSSQVVNTAIHNPHYYAYIRQQGTAAGGGGAAGAGAGGAAGGGGAGAVNACGAGGFGAGGRPQVPLSVIAGEFGNAYRLALHVDAVAAVDAQEADHARLRGLFLIGAITDKEFRRRVYLADRRQARRQEAALVTQTVCDVLVDLAAQVGNNALTCAEAIVQAVAIAEYANGCWQALANVHKVYFPAVKMASRMDDWTFCLYGTHPQKVPRRISDVEEHGFTLKPKRKRKAPSSPTK